MRRGCGRGDGPRCFGACTHRLTYQTLKALTLVRAADGVHATSMVYGRAQRMNLAASFLPPGLRYPARRGDLEQAVRPGVHLATLMARGLDDFASRCAARRIIHISFLSKKA